MPQTVSVYPCRGVLVELHSLTVRNSSGSHPSTLNDTLDIQQITSTAVKYLIIGVTSAANGQLQHATAFRCCNLVTL